MTAISTYLWAVHAEATRRGYNFDASKIARKPQPVSILVTEGQLAVEWEHLKAKLWHRDRQRFRRACHIEVVLPHPLFTVVPGEVEPWERTGSTAKVRPRSTR